MGSSRLTSQCVACRELVQQVQEVLIQHGAFSAKEANWYMCELAKARTLLIMEVPGGTVTERSGWSESSQEVTNADAGRWLATR